MQKTGFVNLRNVQKPRFDNLRIVQNAVALMLTGAGHKLFFFSKYDESAENRMEIDFLIAKSKLTNRHNISPYIHDPVAVSSLHHQEVNLDIYSLMNPATV